jgi:hypothetical protein
VSSLALLDWWKLRVQPNGIGYRKVVQLRQGLAGVRVVDLLALLAVILYWLYPSGERSAERLLSHKVRDVREFGH